MKHIDGLSKAHGVNGSISIAIMILDNFENTRSSEALQRFRGRMFVTALCLIERKADIALHLCWEAFQIFSATRYLVNRLHVAPSAWYGKSTIDRKVCQALFRTFAYADAAGRTVRTFMRDEEA
jgi:hypothetical protein